MDEEIIFHRYEVRPVDDELLTLLKKIRYDHVLMVLKPVLEAEGYEIEDIKLRRVKFSDESLTGKDFHSLQTDKYHSVFMLVVWKGSRKDYAIYQPFSQKVYLVDVDEIEAFYAVSAKECVQFTLYYGCSKCPFSHYTIIKRSSRRFRYEKRWFKDEMQLFALEDLSVTREVLYSGQSLEEGFYLDSESENLKSYRAMYFRCIDNE